MGYNPNFINGQSVNLPTLSDALVPLAFESGTPIDHSRFSIIFHEQRHLAFVTAHNIDGTDVISAGVIPRNNNFRFDQKVPSSIQIDNDRGYHRNPWDRGHLVRRRSLHWGDVGEATTADSESFFWTNIAPQHTDLHHSAWGQIEDWMLSHADDGNKRACVFTGPVLTAADPVITNKPDEIPFQLPAGFWKVMAIEHEGELRAAGFLVWQRDFDRDDPVEFDPILEQVRITTLEFLTGLSFTDLRDADPLRFGVTFNARRAPASTAESSTDRPMPIRSRTIRPGSALPRPAAITTAADIVL